MLRLQLAPNSRFAVIVRLLTRLAHRDETMTSGPLARSVNTNPAMVRRVLGLLADAGLVVLQAGAAGGCCLAGAPGGITPRDVCAAVEEGGLFGMHENPAARQCAVSCSIKSILGDIFGAAEKPVFASLEATTVAGVMTRVRRQERAGAARALRPGAETARSS